MRSFNFTVEGGRENVVNIPVDNPGTATTGRLLADTGSGMQVRSEATVTISGDTATVTIPASLADVMYNAKWVLQAFEGTTPVNAADGRARKTGGGDVAVEINNADGTPIAVSVDRSQAQPVTGTVDLGTASLSALETVSLGPSSEIVGYTSNVVSRKVGEGKVFIGGTAITLGGLASTDRACLQLLNPATSTKALYIFGLTVYSSIAQQVVYTEDATMGGTVTNHTPFNLNRASASASLAVVSSSIAAPTGGVNWPNQSRVTVQQGLEITLPPVVLPPGKSFLVRGTVGDAQTFTANAYWFEE